MLDTPPKILFCDLRLDPGESKTCTCLYICGKKLTIMWSEISTLLLKNKKLNTIMMRFLDGFPYIALSHLCVWDSDSLANIVILSQTHTVRLFPLMGLPVSVVRRWSTSTNWPLAVKGSTRPSSYFVFPLECWFCKVNGLLTDSGFHFTVVATEKQGLKDLCFSCSIILERQQNQRSIGKKILWI